MSDESAIPRFDELQFKAAPYETVASELALRATEVREEPEGSEYDYEGLERALGLEN